MDPVYTLVRSRRRTLSLEVTRTGQVVVRAPLRASKRVIDEFVQSRQDWLRTHLARQARYLAEHPEPTAQEEARLKALAREVIPQRVAHFSARMGLTPTGVKITSAKTRFGSCSAKNSLCFSWRLMAYPMDAVDYVVVHELAHIVHKDHQAGFYRLVESVLPDYRRRQALLRP